MPETTKKPTGGVTNRAGYTFVTNGAEPYSVGAITAKTIYEICDYVYVAGPVTQMVSLIISGEPRITVYDGNGDAVEDVSRELNTMFSQPKCNLSSVARSALTDLLVWGPSIYNWVWERVGGRLVCNELTRLHPYNFRSAPSLNSLDKTFGRVLKGIVYDHGDRRIHYYQTSNATPTEINSDDLFVIRDPSDNYPDGESVIYPVAAIVEFLNYAWNTLGQQMYRVGAPLLMIKINDPQPERVLAGQTILSDVDYAQQILANWGKDTAYTLRQNFEIVETKVTEGSLAIRSIDTAGGTIRDYLNPVGMLGKDGALISGNSDAALQLLNNYLSGWARMLETQMSELPNRYLKYNGYPADWHAVVKIPQTAIKDTNMNIQRAQMGLSSKTLFKNEIRALLGAEELSEEELAKLEDEYPTQTVTQMFSDILRTHNKARDTISNESEDELGEGVDKLERSVIRGVLAELDGK